MVGTIVGGYDEQLEGNGWTAGFSDGNICPRFNSTSKDGSLSSSTTDIHTIGTGIHLCLKQEANLQFCGIFNICLG